MCKCSNTKTRCRMFVLQLVAPERIALTVPQCQGLSPLAEGDEMSTYVRVRQDQAALHGAAYTDRFLGLRVVFTSWSGQKHAGMITRFDGIYPVASLDSGGWARLDLDIELEQPECPTRTPETDALEAALTADYARLHKEELVGRLRAGREARRG